MAPKLDAFQEEALQFFDEAKGRVIFADGMGGRKTGTTATWLQMHPEVDRVLIVVPKVVHIDHWLDQLSLYAPSWAGGLYRGHGDAERRAAKLVEVAAHGGIYVTTYASMRKDDLRLMATHFKTVVFDEGHALKGRTTQQAKVANALTKGAEYILIVTGTPVLNKPEEFWQYLHMLDRKTYRSYWAWVYENFIVEMQQFGRYGRPVRIIGDYLPGRLEAVQAQLAGVMLQRPIEELFTDEWTQEPDHVVVEVTLSKHEWKSYEALVRHGWADVHGTVIQAGNALALSTRLMQMASDWGALQADFTPGSKVLAAADDIREWVRDGPVVAFVSYVNTAVQLWAALKARGINAVTYTGADSPAVRAERLRDFGESDGPTVLIGTIAALAEGVDGLQQRSCHIAMLDRAWVPAINDQAIGRLRRSGQTRRVVVRHYVALGTIEERQLETNLRKLNMVELLTGRPVHAAIYGWSGDRDG